MVISPEAQNAIALSTEKHEQLLLALIRKGEIALALKEARSGAPDYIKHQLASECAVRGMRAEAEEFAASRTPAGLTTEEEAHLRKLEKSV